MANVNGTRYDLELVPGSLYLQGCRVRSLVDHDRRRILISDTVPVDQRLDLVDAALAVAERDIAAPGPFAFIYRRS